MVVNNNAASWLLSEITHDFDNSFIFKHRTVAQKREMKLR